MPHRKIIQKLVAISATDQSPVQFALTLTPPLKLPPNSYMNVDCVKTNIFELFFADQVVPNLLDDDEGYGHSLFLGIQGLGGGFNGMRILAPPDATHGSSITNLKDAGIIWIGNNDDFGITTSENDMRGYFSINNNKTLYITELRFQLYNFDGVPFRVPELDPSVLDSSYNTNIQLTFFNEENPAQTIQDLMSILKSNNQLAIEDGTNDTEAIEKINNNPKDSLKE